jgi:integrase
MRLYVRPTFDSTPVVKITKPKLIDLRTSLKERDEPIGNTLFAALSAACNFIEQGWCSENAVGFIKPLEVAERPFVWLQSAGDVQKLLGECNDNIRTLVAVLVGTGMRLDEALHLMWTDVDLQHRVIHVHRGRRGRRGAPKSGLLRHVPIFDSVLSVLREMKLAKGKNTLLWPGAKLDKLDEQLPRNKTACSVRSRPPSSAPASRRSSASTICGTRSPACSSRLAATSSSSRRSSATRASPLRRRSTRTSTRTLSPRTTAALRSLCLRRAASC